MANAAVRAPGVVEEVAKAAGDLSRQPNAARWFSIVAIVAIVLGFVYLVIRDMSRDVAPKGITAEEFRAAMAQRDAVLGPSTDAAVLKVTVAVEMLAREVERQGVEAGAGRTALSDQIRVQSERIDRVLEALRIR